CPLDILLLSARSCRSARLPLQNVPFVEPASTSIILPPSRTMAACSRDTPSSSTRMSETSPPPTVDRSPLSLYISPKLGPEMTTRYALGAAFSRGTGEMDGDRLRVVSSSERAILLRC